MIGQFISRAHRVSSGDVTVLDDRRIKIEAFNYDGQGPGMCMIVYFAVNQFEIIFPFFLSDEKEQEDKC